MLQKDPEKCHFFPRVLEDEGVVVARATEEVGGPDHGDVLQTHLRLLDAFWRDKILEGGREGGRKRERGREREGGIRERER